MLVTNVRQQRRIGRAAAAAGGYFQLARRLSQAQANSGGRESSAPEAPRAGNEGAATQR
ncbi:hypothetical protein [Sphingomonas carotinifaciens]|uniref:Uncharacterized protein n=1 Tax=Sphingomonas carotinifaciens TaxID=1166323 RepID=A0A1G7PU20_9SPHN|nr:hypothetical protein [Sphingomonas carotinifaciens]MBB4087506.1 hypothetical protein [Sphingomonas carotinifaciens]MWC45593.1 hypothetical protein [Sphingomonas carotinifaciens]SDF89822.1 hypothetical protein SAMN05216557_10781 [Sphingomonas carotinifaciens]